MDGEGIARWRLRSLRLAGPPSASPAAVVGWLGAVQSQDYAPAKWSLGQRTRVATDAAVEAAVAAGTILRTHVLRPTWHFVLPRDIRWMLALTAPRVRALTAYHDRLHALDAALLKRSARLLARTLAGGAHQTRQEIQAVLAGAGIAAAGSRLAHLLMHAELDGLICSGAPRGKQQTYALLDERVPPAPGLGHDEALAELTRRYFTSHGPATAKDFRWWSSLTLAEVRRGLDMVAAELGRETVDGVAYWFAGPRRRQRRPTSPEVHLLQVFDEYLVGYSESRHLLRLSGEAKDPLLSSAATKGVVILDTQLAGQWKRTVEKGSARIEVSTHRPLGDDARQTLHAAARRHGDFLGLPATSNVSLAVSRG